MWGTEDLLDSQNVRVRILEENMSWYGLDVLGVKIKGRCTEYDIQIMILDLNHTYIIYLAHLKVPMLPIIPDQMRWFLSTLYKTWLLISVSSVSI